MSCESTSPPTYCSHASPELKLYQAFIFSVPIFFTLILLLMFYLFYLRRRRANWQLIQMRAAHLSRGGDARSSGCGIKKEIREMLPVVVFRESFLIRETQCSVCLADYQSDERLQKIPHCGHTFHVDCIDHWLATNTTCPLCRVSLLPAIKVVTDPRNNEVQTTGQEDSGEPSLDNTQATIILPETGDKGFGHGNEAGEGSVATDVEALSSSERTMNTIS